MAELLQHDPNRTLDQPAVESPSTLDATGAYQPAADTEPRATRVATDAPAIPGYTITGEIARGGMGRVLSGRELSLDREVAIKVMLPGADAGRFVIESKITAKLPHPNIPPVYALGTLADGSPFLAMKYIRGRTLADELKARLDPKAELPRFLQIFEQIAQAVGFAHSRGIIHRDLKPANVMVGEFGEVQVMDWGLAREVRSEELGLQSEESEIRHSEMTQPGAIMGTPAYMAPEQARGESVDERADVFALGGVLTAILTGKAVFAGGSAVETIRRAALGDTGEALARLAACGADTELFAVATTCLQAERDARPADGRAVATMVADYRQGVEERLKTAERERGEAVVRDAEQRKRRRVLAWSAVAVLLVSVVGTAVSLWKAEQAETAADAATQAEAATAAQLVKTQAAEAAANARTKSLIDTYSDFVFSIQNKLEDRPGTLEIRKELLTIARTGLVQILEDARKQGTPDSTLVVSHLRMGDVELSLGNSLAAQKEYQAGHEIARLLTDADPKNTRAQRDLSISYNRLGDVTLKLGDTQDALAFYEKAMKFRQTLADTDPKNPQVQRELSVSYDNLGDVTLKLGNTQDALDFYKKGLKIRQSLADANPTDAEAQRDLSASHDKLGNLTVQLGNIQDSLDFYQKGLKIRKTLVDADPKNTQAQRDLSVSYDKLGNVTLQLGKTKDALDFYEKALKIRQTLADTDPNNTQAQRDLSVGYEKLGNVTLQLGNTQDALGFYQKGLKIDQTLADADPKNADAQTALFVSFYKLGSVEKTEHKYAKAAEWFAKGLNQIDPIKRAGRLSAQQATWPALLEQELAACRNAEKAIADIEFVFQQPAEQIPALLEIRVKAVLHRKKLADAVVTTERWATWAEKQEKGGRDGQRYNAAFAFALCAAAIEADREKLLDRSLALLRLAKSGGFFDAAKIAHIKQDSDFDGIRTHPKFAAFLNSFDKPAEHAPLPRPAPEK